MNALQVVSELVIFESRSLFSNLARLESRSPNLARLESRSPNLAPSESRSPNLARRILLARVGAPPESRSPNLAPESRTPRISLPESRFRISHTLPNLAPYNKEDLIQNFTGDL